MKILGLDISTKTGYALLCDGVLTEHGLIRCDETVSDPLLVPDYKYIQRSKDIAEKIHRLVCKHMPDYIYLEATNAGRFRGSQKQLEFLHYSILDKLQQCCRKAESVRYIDTSAWRSLLGIRLNKDQKKHNSVKSKAKRSGKANLSLSAVGKEKVRGRITPKHLAVWWANDTFNLSLKLKDNDIADALAVSFCGWLTERDAAKAVTEYLLKPLTVV